MPVSVELPSPEIEPVTEPTPRPPVRKKPPVVEG